MGIVLIAIALVVTTLAIGAIAIGAFVFGAFTLFGGLSILFSTPLVTFFFLGLGIAALGLGLVLGCIAHLVAAKLLGALRRNLQQMNGGREGV